MELHQAVDGDRLRADIEENAAHGAHDEEAGTGRTVLTGSPADRGVRDRFVQCLEDAGCSVRIDSVGNIAGRWVPEGVDPATDPIALGSHLDSVPRGGMFDGPLGVYGALEALRVLQAVESDLDRPIEVVSFTEEEGARFGVGTLGSSVATGALATEEARELTDDEGVTLAEHLDAVGFDGDGHIDAADWEAWLELHIEQDTRLESAGSPVGIVESITGLTNGEIEISGQADHAGTSGMDRRSDALSAGAAVVLAVEELGRSAAERGASAVATVGKVAVSPNVRNIVPGQVTMQTDFRAASLDLLDEMVEQCREAVAEIADQRGLDATYNRYRTKPPRHMSERCVRAALDAAAACDVEPLRLDSGALHDTANVATVTDAGMLFAPSRDGISHTPREWTDWEDCASAVEVLAGAAYQLATE